MTTNPEPQAQADASLGEIKRQIIYKGQGQHCEVQLAHQFYPSSKTCSNCSNVNAKLKREPRWQCPSCGMNHDRNINAAVNLRELLTLPPGSGVKLRDGMALTVHQTGQKTGQSSFQQAVSYSEIPLKCSDYENPAISPSRNPAHHFRRLFDDSHALFVLNSVHPFGYNGTYPNKRSYSDAFTNRSENRSEKRPGIGSW